MNYSCADWLRPTLSAPWQPSSTAEALGSRGYVGMAGSVLPVALGKTASLYSPNRARVYRSPFLIHAYIIGQVVGFTRLCYFHTVE